MKVTHMLAAVAAMSATALVADAAQATPVVYADNGHAYEFVRGVHSWTEALALASSRTFNGQTGYLATVTSAGENAFIASLFGPNDLAWIGASDTNAEGSFTWRSGPEAGQALGFSGWNAGEPNGAGFENYVHMYANGSWNDAPDNYGLSYIVEFAPPAAVPEPATWAMMVLGFGVVGHSLRRRGSRKAVQAA